MGSSHLATDDCWTRYYLLRQRQALRDPEPYTVSQLKPHRILLVMTKILFTRLQVTLFHRENTYFDVHCTPYLRTHLSSLLTVLFPKAQHQLPTTCHSFFLTSFLPSSTSADLTCYQGCPTAISAVSALSAFLPHQGNSGVSLNTVTLQIPIS